MYLARYLRTCAQQIGFGLFDHGGRFERRRRLSERNLRRSFGRLEIKGVRTALIVLHVEVGDGFVRVGRGLGLAEFLRLFLGVIDRGPGVGLCRRRRGFDGNRRLLLDLPGRRH